MAPILDPPSSYGKLALIPLGSGFGHTPGFFLSDVPMSRQPDRAIVLVDGNNWYHSLSNSGVSNQGALNFAKISRKVVGPRTWVATRYYVGQVQQTGNADLYAAQRRFLSYLTSCDPRISFHFGRLEQRPVVSEAAKEVLRYLGNLKIRIDIRVYKDLLAIAKAHERTTVIVEKAVDVHLAVDLVVGAERNEYDAAYILSADGDLTPAVEAAKALNKKVFAVSMSQGAQLAAAVNSFIRIVASWVADCYDNP
jgi:uncharacterized LabA/DUF88 family protein